MDAIEAVKIAAEVTDGELYDGMKDAEKLLTEVTIWVAAFTQEGLWSDQKQWQVKTIVGAIDSIGVAVAAATGSPVRISRSEGYNNQGYYFSQFHLDFSNTTPPAEGKE